MVTVWCAAMDAGATYTFVESPAEFAVFPSPREPTPAGTILHVTAWLAVPLGRTSAVRVADWPCVRLLAEVVKVMHGYPLAQSLAEA
jgi:hypothetical protein